MWVFFGVGDILWQKIKQAEASVLLSMLDNIQPAFISFFNLQVCSDEQKSAGYFWD